MKNIFILFFILLLGRSIAHSQTTSYVFDPILMDQGHINDIMRDSEGFIWISTQDGLTKYNGSQFIQYNYNRKDRNSIPHNYVWTTFEDSRKNIWVGLFGGGLCLFDKVTNKFYQHDQNGYTTRHGIRVIDQFNDSTIIVGTDHGLYLFDLDSYSFDSDTTFQHNQYQAGLFHTHSVSIIQQNILVAGENGGYILTPHTNQVLKINLEHEGYLDVRYLHKIENNKVFLADNNYFSIAEYNATTNKFTIQQKYKSNTPLTINDISPKDNDQILIMAEEGIFILDFTYNTLQQIPSDQPELNNLSDKVAYCIETIEPDLKWIGTKTKIYEYSEKSSPFKHILSEELCGSAILGLTEDDNGNLWVATRKGLGRIQDFDKGIENWKYFCYDQNSNPEMKNNYLLNVSEIEGQLYVGYRKYGFALLTLGKEDNVLFESPPPLIHAMTKNGSVSNFMLDQDKYIWVSTSGNGVIKWNSRDPTDAYQYKNKDGQHNILSHNYTFGFEELDSAWVAVATATGISVIHKKSDSTYQILSGRDSLNLSGNFIMDFERDHEGRLWVCTDGGVNLWNTDNTFQSWTTNEGLPNDVVYGMLNFENEQWVSTNKGLVRINNLRSPSFSTYTKEDDVLNNEHNQFSFYKSKNNELCFGGKKGITVFNPKDIQPNTNVSIPVIENFKLFNQNGSTKNSTHINYISELILDYNQNFLTFELASLSYYKSEQNQYRYKLHPLNEDWIYLESRNFISLNGLAPNNYLLSIQSSNNDGIWGNQTKELAIIIKKPIYNRWYAWLVYILILSGIIYSFYRMKISHIKNLAIVREEERANIRERSAQDFHDEVGSLITKLSLMNQYALSNIDQADDENISILNKMQVNIQKIRTGMKDFIWVLDPSKDSLQSSIIRIKTIGNDLFEHTQTTFQCIVSQNLDQSVELNGVQRRQLILFIKEVLHNIVKHANAKKCVVTIQVDPHMLKFIIEDDGIGFDLASYKAGMGLKSMHIRAKKMNGQVVVKSDKGSGTTITLNLLPTQMGYRISQQ
ncbi:MAG: two-component regulator propeller domain-containing protein [Saprospiraceae bacterium]|nr:two-component regulator propeller domain-containing protein [Saprospiraceae bacterium]